ncbi:CRTAC1 family protein [Occallatibacter riparius]|uniref:CRTAC1 family protein n=1 Tax=Occallatibacter riparius TaxID=1002689 RepID=A0A9J7BS95_9BACT|nr:CRTAC1 family protein [Occallatibacter riparius]UWZ83782.1 CRTAC1 family protein [Occallatibacter riparius]
MKLLVALAVIAVSGAQIGWAQAKAPQPTQKSAIQFEDATAKAGIDFVHSFGSRQLGSLLEGTGAGCVWFDYNNDGLPDLYVANGRPLDDSMHPYPLKDKPNPLPHNHLFRNNGNGTFTDVTDKAGLNPDMYSIAVAAADFDNDGFEDLLVTAYGRAILYHNDGNGHFTDVTAKAGIKVDGWAIASTWLDYDKDGCLDLFVGRYVKFDPKYRAFYAADNYPGPLDYEGETNKLFHNNCDGTFTDVSEKSSISAFVGRTMGVTAADYDGDGWDDIYVANDRTENFLFHNKHDGTFEEVANDTGTAFGQNGESTSSMGPVFADFEQRGVFDLWVTDGHYNRYLRNAGKQGFEDAGASNGVSQTNAQYVSWGTGVYDYDNDGLLDILIFHGGLIHLIPQEHTLFRGLGGAKFEDISRDAGSVLSVRTTARGACFADYDNDGKVDGFVVNLGAKGTLIHNVSPSTGHWLAVTLKGAKSNRDGIGAKVEVFAGGKKWLAERVAGTGYLSQDDGRMHFGLGAVAAVDKIVVHWPSGADQTVEKLATDHVITIEETK